MIYQIIIINFQLLYFVGENWDLQRFDSSPAVKISECSDSFKDEIKNILLTECNEKCYCNDLSNKKKLLK